MIDARQPIKYRGLWSIIIASAAFCACNKIPNEVYMDGTVHSLHDRIGREALIEVSQPQMLEKQKFLVILR